MLLLGFACKKENPTPNPIPTPTPSGKDSLVEIKTSFGTMIMYLNKSTPLHKSNFLKLTQDNFFDNTTFHRCVTDFVIQGGDPLSKDTDPNNDGTGGPGYTIPKEIDATKYKHVYGAVGAARQGDAVNPSRASNGSQYYICTNSAGSPHLDGAYTVFGKIISGMDVAIKINQQPKNGNGRPNTNIVMDCNLLLKTAEQIKTDYGFTVE